MMASSTPETPMAQPPNLTNLELVSRVDTWPYFHKDPAAYKQHMKQYFYFMIKGFPHPFGYVHTSTVTSATWPPFWTISAPTRTLIFSGGDTFTQRTWNMQNTLRANLHSGAFGPWSDELFPLCAADGEHVLDMDGAGVDAFGIVNFSCHCTAYTNVTASSGEEERRYWVPRRARTKMSFPGMLDNSVGGSLRARESALECVVREAGEEASLSAEFVRRNVRACGTLSYGMTRTDWGAEGCQWQVQYVFELEVPEGMVLEPGDGEAESFTLMTLEEVVGALRRGEFKGNCGMTWMALLIRHGVVNAENEKDLVEICSRLHRRVELFVV